MADRHDPIVDDTPNKRRKLDPAQSSGKAWDSQEDSGEEFNEDDFQTAATLPLPAAQKRKLGYTASQMRQDLGTVGTTLPSSSSSQLGYVTQPTQTLKPVTQATQMLFTREPPEVQVERSSPISAPASFSLQRPVPPPITRAPFAKPGGLLASAMAPAGTAFRRPPGVQPKPPIYDLESDDDPPVRHSDDEETQKGGIKPTNFKKGGRGIDSSPNRTTVKASPQHLASSGGNIFDNMLSEFGYKASPPSDLVSAYGNTSRAPRPPQQPKHTGPPRTTMPQLSHPTWNNLDDLDDFGLKRKVVQMQSILGPNIPVGRCVEALIQNKNHVNDAMVWLADLEAEESPMDELSLSPVAKKGVALTIPSSSNRHESSQVVRPAAKQSVSVPSRTIAEKYRRGPVREATTQDSSDEEEQVRPRRSRLVRGRKPSPISSPPPTSDPPQSRKRLQNRTVIDIDSNSENDSGIGCDVSVEVLEAPKPEEVKAGVQELRDVRLLKLINESTAHELVELSGQPEDKIQFVLDKRPFDNLDDVRDVVQERLTKAGKKSKKSTPIGEKLVDDCFDVMSGYDAIDELVFQCEILAKPVQEALRGWGVGDADGELQLMSLDEAHDSGIGSPSSSGPADEQPLKGTHSQPRNNFIGKPHNMSKDLVLKNYQLVGLNWLYLLYKKGLSCILADEMGLGKTCQIISFLSYLKVRETDGVHLIIVPGSTLENWLREFNKFAPDIKYIPYYGEQAERAYLRETIKKEWRTLDVIVTTYDMATPKEDNAFLRNVGPFKCCVWDEAHNLKNPHSKRYRQLVRIEVEFKVFLTGTPLQNNLQELIAILAFIMPDLFYDKWVELQHVFKHKASTKDTSAAALLASDRVARARTMMTPFILRRKKIQVLDLPAKTCRVEYCDMTATQVECYQEIVEQVKDSKSLSTNAKGTAKERSNLLMALRKAAIHPLLLRRIFTEKKLKDLVKTLSKSDEFGGNPPDKIRAYLNGEAAISLKGGDFGLHKFCYDRDILRKRFALQKQEWMDSGKVKKFEELVTNFARNGDRVLVFSQFTTLMDILEAVLEQLNMKFLRLDGSTKMDTRQEMIDKFYDDQTIPVFMLSTKAGGAGINLAAANKVIIFDSGFNPQDDVQAENRAHRVGQTREVEVIRLVTRGTIEEAIHALGESKLALDEKIAGEGATSAESAAEKAGEHMVERMFMESLNGDDGSKEKAKMTASNVDDAMDIKEAFRMGMEGEGVSVKSKQALL